MTLLHRYANPTRFLRLANAVLPWVTGLTVILIGAGVYFAFGASPPDYQQGQTVRIMYVHVPSAWMAMFAYAFIVVASAVGLIWKHPVAHVCALAAAPIGASFTVICLTTGSLWGKPMWGTWWVWDARLTSVLVLLFLYLGFIERVRRRGAGGKGIGNSGADRRRKFADHQILGRLVEHPASARECDQDRDAGNPQFDADTAASDGGRLHNAFRNAADRACPRRIGDTPDQCVAIRPDSCGSRQ